MADVAAAPAPTPAAQPAANANGNGSAAEKHEKHQHVRPEKPDDEQYKEALAQAEKEHAAAQEKVNAAKAKVDLARGGGKDKDSPNAKRQQELKTELNAIRQSQQGNKASRSAIHEKVKKLDEQLKSRIAELKTAKGRVNFNKVEDVDREIAHLQKQVDTGTMKLVDEKKALAEMSSLNKLRKNFGGFELQQKGIDDVKAQIAEQKKLLDDPEQKALSEKYTVLQTELDALKAEQDEAYKSLNVLRDAMTKARNEQQEKYTAMKQIKDTYFQQKRAFQEYEFQARKAKNERRRVEQLEWQSTKRKENAAKRLDEASAAAYQDEILTAEGLIRFFDPSALAAKEETIVSKFAAAAQRTVDAAGLKGVRIAKKDEPEENYFIGGGGKKGKKGKKGGAAAAAPAEPKAAKFNVNYGVLEELSKVGVDAPSSQEDVPAVVAKLQAKLAHWKEDQDRKTKENIAKAQKEIDRLEAEDLEEAAKDHGVPRKPAHKKEANGTPAVVAAPATPEVVEEKTPVAEVTEHLEEASIEEKTEETAAPVEA